MQILPIAAAGMLLMVALECFVMKGSDLDWKKMVLAAIALVGFAAMVFGLPPLIGLFAPETCIVNGVCEHEGRLNMITQSIPFFVGLGVIAGAGIYWFMSRQLVEKQKSLQNTAEIVLQFLGGEEKAIVKKLVEENGKCLQAEISRIEGIGKLKSHRILQRMKEKRVIEIEKFGKTNIVRLSKNIREGLV